jgi:hypothetical protein
VLLLGALLGDLFVQSIGAQACSSDRRAEHFDLQPLSARVGITSSNVDATSMSYAKFLVDEAIRRRGLPAFG